VLNFGPSDEKSWYNSNFPVHTGYSFSEAITLASNSPKLEIFFY
jgi:hypothetical protein